MDYSLCIRLEKILVVIEESKALTKSNQIEKSNPNQQRRCWCDSTNQLRITCMACPVELTMIGAKKGHRYGYISRLDK